MMRRALPLLALGPALASAQPLAELTMQLGDGDPGLRLQGGLAACLGDFDSPATPAQMHDAFAVMGWQPQQVAQGAAYSFRHSRVHIAADGTLCEISDPGVTQPQAAQIVRSTFAEMGRPLWPETDGPETDGPETEGPETDKAEGCTIFTAPDGRRIEIARRPGTRCGDMPPGAIRVRHAGGEG